MSDAAPASTVYAGPRRVLSGIQASGALHLGNYLGALKRFTALQDAGAPCFLFVADLHAITVWQDPALLAAQTREIAAAYLASAAKRCYGSRLTGLTHGPPDICPLSGGDCRARRLRHAPAGSAANRDLDGMGAGPG